MNSDCPRIEDLAGIAELGPGDPRRRHLDGCPRCQARLAGYQEFMRGAGECDQDQLDAAVDLLGAKLDREILGRHEDAAPERGRSIFSFQSPYVRGALALAACVLLFFALFGLRDRTERDGRAPGDILLRSGETTPPEGSILLDEPRYPADGGVELSWRPLPDADMYVVKILNAELDQVADVPAGSAGSLVLESARLHELVSGAGAYAWIVIALSEGEEIARSRASSFRFGAD